MNYLNRKIKITTSTISILLAFAGSLNHGIFEILQGNTPTNGVFIEAIGESDRYWIHGTEAAFTVIPNFLITGILVILVSSGIIIWALYFLEIKYGPSVLISLFILLTVVGGGIGHIILFLPTWAYSTRIRASLNFWDRIFSVKFRKALSKLWQFTLILTCITWLTVMELGIFGYFPGISDPDKILNIVFVFLLATVILANITFISAICVDLEDRKLMDEFLD